MAIEFYNVKKRKKVSISEESIEKVEYKKETSKGTQVRWHQLNQVLFQTRLRFC